MRAAITAAAHTPAMLNIKPFFMRPLEFNYDDGSDRPADSYPANAPSVKNIWSNEYPDARENGDPGFGISFTEIIPVIIDVFDAKI